MFESKVLRIRGQQRTDKKEVVLGGLRKLRIDELQDLYR